MKATMVTVIMVAIMILSPTVSSSKITVGGSNDWNVSTPIYVNDTLQFIYPQPPDVVEVSEPDFTTCNTSNPITVYKNMNKSEILINLNKTGSRYFVSDRFNNCTLGLKLHVQVLDRPMPPQAGNNQQPNNEDIVYCLMGIVLFLYLIFVVVVIASNLEDISKVMYFTLGTILMFLILLLA